LFLRGEARDTAVVKRGFFLFLLFAGIVLPLCADDDLPPIELPQN
jgi:hypothetical protein